MGNMFRSIGLLALMLTGSFVCLAVHADARPINAHPELPGYIDTLVAEHQFSRAELEALFADVPVRQDIIDKISRPAERVWTWGRYKGHLVDPARVKAGVAFWSEHADTLARAQQVYGVAPEIILAILGVETRYGQITGSYPVVEALSTLGFAYPPRAKFFRKELTQFLLLAREEGMAPLTLNGSYAGAMGYGQFIPSSYRHYAVDFDDDGLRDIWHNPVDAIGSIGNYFARHRWAGEQPVAIALTPTEALAAGKYDTGLKLHSSVGQLQAAGLVPEDIGVAAETPARVYRVEGAQGLEYWLALPDFYVITRYNHSHLYALAIHHLAQEIKALRRAQ